MYIYNIIVKSTQTNIYPIYVGMHIFFDVIRLFMLMLLLLCWWCYSSYLMWTKNIRVYAIFGCEWVWWLVYNIKLTRNIIVSWSQRVGYLVSWLESVSRQLVVKRSSWSLSHCICEKAIQLLTCHLRFY